jgi:hypothetical protein
MTEWWTYRLEDFLLFAPRVYWRMFELHNATLWPLHALTLAAGITIVLVILLRPLRHDRWIVLVLAVLWAFVGWSFLWNRYAAINWAIAYFAPLFAFEAILLLIAGTVFNGLTFDRRGIVGWIGLVLVALGIAAYPFFAPLFGRPWSGAEIFGIAPDPTAIATVGFLLLVRGWPPVLLTLIPILWLLLSGLTLWTMGDPQAGFPLLGGATPCAALVLRAIIRPNA